MIQCTIAVNPNGYSIMGQDSKNRVSSAVRLIAGFLAGAILAILVVVLVSVFNPVNSGTEYELLQTSGTTGFSES